MLESRFVRVSSAGIHYIEQGTGKPVVLLHGASFNARTWEETNTIQSIAKAGFRSISVDLPGKGRSEAGEFSGDRITGFLDGFLSTLGVEKPIILGASLGGYVAMDYAMRNADGVGGLVLVAPAYWIMKDRDEEMKKLRGIPSLLIVGSEDSYMAQDDARRLKDLIGSRELAFIGKIHPCYLEKPEDFNGKVCEFLEGMKK